jgi:hypothetical protein
VPNEVVVESGEPKSQPNSAAALGSRAGTDLAIGSDATRYVGRPAVATSKVAATRGHPFDRDRRKQN